MADLTDTRAVVASDERFDGKIIPTVQSEIGRTITVEAGAVVTGGIYGDEVSIGPDARVDSSLMASSSVELDGCDIMGDVGCDGRIIATDAYTHSSVSGTAVRLQDCVVRGNVVGTTVRLENCLVLGIVAAEKELVLENSLCYTFKALGGGECSNSQVLLPQATAAPSFDLEDPLSVIGLPISDDDSTEIQLHDGHRIKHDGTTYLTIADRVLDLEGIDDRIEQLETMLRSAVDEAETASAAELRSTIATALDVDEARLPG